MCSHCVNIVFTLCSHYFHPVRTHRSHCVNAVLRFRRRVTVVKTMDILPVCYSLSLLFPSESPVFVFSFLPQARNRFVSNNLARFSLSSETLWEWDAILSAISSRTWTYLGFKCQSWMRFPTSTRKELENLSSKKLFSDIRMCWHFFVNVLREWSSVCRNPLVLAGLR
jgi:hypothetical protein